MLVFFSGYLYGFYFTGLGVMIGIIWVDLCKGLHKKQEEVIYFFYKLYFCGIALSLNITGL